jgi:hypothetical protein
VSERRVLSVIAMFRQLTSLALCWRLFTAPIETNRLPVSPIPTRTASGHLLDAITLVMLRLPGRRSHTCTHETVLVWTQTLFWS